MSFLFSVENYNIFSIQYFYLQNYHQMTLNTVSALNLNILQQIPNLNPSSTFACTSTHNTAVVYAHPTNGLILDLYQITNSQINSKTIQINEDYSLSSCLVMSTDPIITMLVLATSGLSTRLYQLNISSPINNDQPILSQISSNPYKQMGRITDSEIVLVSSNNITNRPESWTIPYSQMDNLNLVSPKLLVLTDPTEFYLIQVSSHFPAFILKYLPTSNSTTIISVYSENQNQQWNELKTDSNQNIIAISLKNLQNQPTGQFFFNRELILLSSNLNDRRFYQFSQAQGAMIVYSDQKICYGPFEANSSVSFTSEVCYPIQSIDHFQQIYINEENHYFFNGQTIFHKNLNANETDPQFFFPNQLWHNSDSLINSSNKYLPLSNGQIIVINSQTLFLVNPEVTEISAQSSQELSQGAIIGITFASLILFFLIVMSVYCYKLRAKKSRKRKNVKSRQPQTTTKQLIASK